MVKVNSSGLWRILSDRNSGVEEMNSLTANANEHWKRKKLHIESTRHKLQELKEKNIQD